MFQLLGSVPGPDKPWSEDVAIAFGNVRWYAILIMFGFIVAIVLACLKMWKRYKISTEPFYWFILIGVPLAIFGANFGSCVLGPPAGKEWSEFWSSFGTGLAVEWGVLFVLVAAFIYFPLILKLPRYRVRDSFGEQPTVKKVSFWMYADAIMPCILIAQFIGRWGNYLNQEVYGAVVTNDGLAKFLHDCLPYMYVGSEWRQPLFLWEGIANLGMFFVMYFGIEFIKQRKSGDLAAGYILWYGALRLGLEPLRDHQYKSDATMIFSAIFVVIGALFILANHLLIANERKNKLLKTLLNFGPAEYFGLMGVGLREFIINFKNKKIKSKIKRKEILHKILLTCDEEKKKIMEQKINSLNSQIIKLQQSVEAKTKKVEEIKVLRKQKRALKIAKNYNSFVNKQKKKYEFLSNKFNNKLQQITDDKKRLLKKQKYDNVLQEIRTQLAEFESQSIKQRQEKNEQIYQSCIRKPNEMIYFGKW